MNNEQITTLQKLLSEIDNSMTRADAEKDLQAEITLRAARECGVDKKDFAVLAKAHHKGDMHIARQRCIDQADLFELIIGEDEYPVLREFRRIDAETKNAQSVLRGIQ